MARLAWKPRQNIEYCKWRRRWRQRSLLQAFEGGKCFFRCVGGLLRPRFFLLASDGPRRVVQAQLSVLCGSCLDWRAIDESSVWQFRTLVSLILVAVLRMGASQRSHALPCWRQWYRRAPATGQPYFSPCVICLDRYYFLVDVCDVVIWPFGSNVERDFLFMSIASLHFPSGGSSRLDHNFDNYTERENTNKLSKVYIHIRHLQRISRFPENWSSNRIQ